MDGRRRTRQVVDLIDLDIERKSDVVPHQLEARIPEQMLDVPFGAGEEIIRAENVLPGRHKALAQMRAEEACAAGHQYALYRVASHASSLNFRNGAVACQTVRASLD